MCWAGRATRMEKYCAVKSMGGKSAETDFVEMTVFSRLCCYCGELEENELREQGQEEQISMRGLCLAGHAARMEKNRKSRARGEIGMVYSL